MKERIIVVGLGEVGKTLYDVLQASGNFEVYGFDLRKEVVSDLHQGVLPKKVDIMHVCIPCTSAEGFTEFVENYRKEFDPQLIIVNSTVIPGTTMEVFRRCGVPTAHSPTRGVHESHEHMVWEMKRWKKYVGGVDAKSGEKAKEHFEKAGLQTKMLKSCVETELAKLFETTYRAWMITCYQEMHRISRKFGAAFDDAVDFLEDTHRVRLDRPVMFPGVIGGHCQIPNTELLLKVYESELLREILESNEKRKEEIKDKAVQEDVEKVKLRAEALEKELMEKIAKCK